MIFGPDGKGDEPSLIVNGVRIPFQMEAHVSHGPAAGGGDDRLVGLGRMRVPRRRHGRRGCPELSGTASRP